jgi:hypothetical protein
MRGKQRIKLPNYISLLNETWDTLEVGLKSHFQMLITNSNEKCNIPKLLEDAGLMELRSLVEYVSVFLIIKKGGITIVIPPFFVSIN